MTYVKDGERIDDLEINGFRIIQNPLFFCFGQDSVLLSDFATVRKGSRCVDLGTGTGIIPLLMAAKCKGADWTGLELQEEVAEMAARSVQMNKAEDVCHIEVGDIRCIPKEWRGAYDTVTCNPPYVRRDSGLKNISETKLISRYEVTVTLREVVEAAAYILKDKGNLAMIHRPQRLTEIMEECTSHGLEVKRLRLVQPYIDKEPNMVMIEAVKGGGRETRVLPTLIIYNKDGSYTEEVLKIYGKCS